MHKKYIHILLCLLILILGHARAQAKTEILVAAASSLKDVLTELGADFEKKNNVKISFNFAASGQLRAQIENGAPVDVFVSASLSDMESLDVIGKVNVASNSLVLAQHISTRTPIKNIAELSKTEIKKIALGNPATVPVGRYAKESLIYFQAYDLLKEKLIFAESARQVLDYILRDEVDAGFVFLTDILGNKKIRTVLELSESSHEPIIYPGAIIKTSKNVTVAQEFLGLLTSKDGKQTFQKYGFK